VENFTRTRLQELVEELKAGSDLCPAAKPQKYDAELTIHNTRLLTYAQPLPQQPTISV